jgi:DNA uptake protein ComE-like DNA-binding protein
MKHLTILLLLLGMITPAMTAERTAKTSGRAQVAAKTLTPAERLKLLSILNEGDDMALQSLPGIGATRSAAIKKARPFTAPLDLVKVEGIGDSMLVEIVAHAKAGFPDRRAGKAETPPR